MRRVLFAFVAVALVLSGCAAGNSINKLSSNPLVSGLRSNLGLTPEQAIGAAGSVLSLAQNKLPKETWNKVAGSIVDSDALIKEGTKLAGVTGGVKDATALNGALDKLGLSAQQKTGLAEGVSRQMGLMGHQDVGSEIMNVMK